MREPPAPSPHPLYAYMFRSDLCGGQHVGKKLRSRGRMTDIQLNRYFEMIHRRVPIKWLRKPSSFAVRLVVAFLLILGGVFSFLPLLGIWMLPLGLMLIAQDAPFLQKPLVQSLAWVEAKLKWLKEKRQKR